MPKEIKIDILELKPTQLCLGVYDIDHKCNKIINLKGNELKEYMKRKQSPVIRYKQYYYLIDHHHYARAMWEVYGNIAISCEVLMDLSSLSEKAFWQIMQDNHYVHLYDHFGDGPLDPIHLPPSIRFMADDPCRSLAFIVRERGGFNKSKIPFAEFYWANFFRTMLGDKVYKQDILTLLDEALLLCNHKNAEISPGFKK